MAFGLGATTLIDYCRKHTCIRIFKEEEIKLISCQIVVAPRDMHRFNEV